MRHLASMFMALGLLALVGSPGRARADVLMNDGYVSGGGAMFAAGFVSGEIAAARFTPAGPAELTAVRILFGGGTSVRTVTLHVWTDSGAVDPGTEIYMGTFEITGADDAIAELDLTGMGVRVSGPFRVGIEFTIAGLPSIASDIDGTISAANNFVRAVPGGWLPSSTVGLGGDWIMRAVVTPDMDAGVTLDASVEDAAIVDASSPLDADIPDMPTPRDASGGVDASGIECRSNAECVAGQYCSAAGVCTFDCRVDGDCESGASCSSLGRCVAPPPTAESGCGCRASSGGRGAPALLGLAVLLLVARRRRTSRR